MLSSIETELLRWFSERPGVVATRDELLVEVWGFPRPVPTRAVDNTIMRLRRKIERDPGDPDHLKTLRGVGYTFESLGAGDHAAVAPVVAAVPAPSLPHDFVGRAADLARLDEALTRSRCVTVLGPGGVGKTRLVREWVATQPEARWCTLAAAEEDSDVRTVIAQAVGAERSEPTAIAGALAGLPGPLVIDNVEGVADVVAALVGAWLADCAELRVVLTSRERLRIAAEHVLELAPLDRDSAVTLFRHHVVAVGGSVEASAPGVFTDIVERLDCLPLALELAAARSRVLPLPQLLTSLDDTARVLRSARRDLPDRHRSIQAAIQGSWDGLDDAGRTTLATVALLVDGFDLDTVEAVVDLGDEGAWPIDVVAALRDRSLLQATDGFEGDARFHLLEVVRQFAEAQCGARSDALVIEDRVVDWFVTRSTRWRAGVHQSAPEPSIQALARERRNLIALARRCATRRPDACAELVFNLGWHLLNRVPDADTLALGVEAADRAGHPRLRTANRLLYGRILEWTGHHDEALRIHDEALELARDGDRPQIAIACFHVSSHLGAAGRTDEAVALCHEGLAAAEEHGRPGVGAMLQQRLGHVLSLAGRHAEARPATLAAFEAYQALGHEAAVPYAVLSLARSDLAHGDVPSGIERCEDAIRRCVELSLSRFRCVATLELAWMYLAGARPGLARSTVDSVRSTMQSFGNPSEDAHLVVLDAVAAFAMRAPIDQEGLARALDALPPRGASTPLWFGDLMRRVDDPGHALPDPSHPEAHALATWSAWFCAPDAATPPDGPSVPSEPSWMDRVCEGVARSRWGRHGITRTEAGGARRP